MVKDDSKVDEVRLYQAAQKLKDIAQKIQDYESHWHTLNQIEQAATGGIVFALHSIYEDLSMIGAIANRPFGAALINQLLEYFNRPPSQPQAPPRSGIRPTIIPAESKPVPSNGEVKGMGRIVTPPTPEVDRISKEKKPIVGLADILKKNKGEV